MDPSHAVRDGQLILLFSLADTLRTVFLREANCSGCELPCVCSRVSQQIPRFVIQVRESHAHREFPSCCPCLTTTASTVVTVLTRSIQRISDGAGTVRLPVRPDFPQDGGAMSRQCPGYPSPVSATGFSWSTSKSMGRREASLWQSPGVVERLRPPSSPHAHAERAICRPPAEIEECRDNLCN
jgi:hypothetical protein